MNINHVLEQFKFKGELESCDIFGSGHINTTFLATYNEDGKKRNYVIQKVNTSIFPDIDALMNNIFSVTDFLREKIKADGGNPHRETLHFIRTFDGNKYFKDEDGSCFRAYRFVDNSKAYDTVDSAEVFGKSGKAFGRFQKYLSDFPAESLSEIIKNFHNTIWRYENEFIPAVQKGFTNAMKSGVLAGYPLDSLKVTLVDGSFHPVDSDQLSFEICAMQAYKNACAKAGPVLMEPIMKLEVVTPEENMGDVIGDLNKRRGQVEGMESSRSGARIVKAMVPLAEMFGYVTALRTITSGRATSSMVYSHHAQVSNSIAKAVLEEVKGRADLL